VVDPIIRAKGLGKSFADTEVVRGIDFSIRPGQCFGFLGPNGAGKTTTLRMILGLSPPTRGSLQVMGYPIPAEASTARRRMGVVPQTDNLDPDFTVEENLRVYGGFFHLPRSVLDGRIPRLLEFVALTEKAKARINTLSGGMKRRLTIARALINDPELIVLDEPTTGLDPQARHMIWARLRDLIQDGKTLLLTTHHMEEAERLCDELVIMDHGAIIEQGSPTEIIRRHVAPEVLEIRTGGDQAQQLLSDVEGLEMEQVGDTLYGYTHDARTALSRLEGVAEMVYLHRPATLEDVFLRLTGRDLRD